MVWINATHQEEFCLVQSCIDEVEEFTYLGSLSCKTGLTDEDNIAKKKGKHNQTILLFGEAKTYALQEKSDF